MYAVEDEPNHIDWLINVEVIDSEKNELKKIINKKQIKKNLQDNSFRRMFEKNPWSEEDDFNLQCCIDKIQYDIDNGRIGRNREILTWLKSLKDRYTWKPSDEQMASITCAVRKMKESVCYDSELVSLFNDLKKLREE